MFEKVLLKSLFRKMKHGGFSVVFWDGEEAAYGDESPAFKLIFHTAPDLGPGDSDPVTWLGEAYMDEIIDYEGSLEDFLRILQLNGQFMAAPDRNMVAATAATSRSCLKDQLRQEQTNIRHHYDCGNDFFSLWLDKTLSYSCAYFKTPDDSLDQAQLQKIDHSLRKLNLKPGEHLLDIGSGWGWLIIRAAQKYGVKATGITLSSEQYAATKERVADLGLAGQVNVEIMNYQELDPRIHHFDKIVSIGMFEHVGKNNLPTYMERVSDLLSDGGLSLLHTITGPDEHPGNNWMLKYIFPGGYVPSLRETVWLLPDYNFQLLHIENLRLHYAMTLDLWYRNFMEHIDAILQKFGTRFTRMWSLYLQACAASFRVTGLSLHQLLFSKGLNNRLPITYDYIYR
ncbi:MAG: class I SAM-dependent methyltransferase [Negativicutes bacterium]|nr:class I SAM-dependent methyltransferase [Negativicutes bacterium]